MIENEPQRFTNRSTTYLYHANTDLIMIIIIIIIIIIISTLFEIRKTKNNYLALQKIYSLIYTNQKNKKNKKTTTTTATTNQQTTTTTGKTNKQNKIKKMMFNKHSSSVTTPSQIKPTRLIYVLHNL